jgi:hypothetical protein
MSQSLYDMMTPEQARMMLAAFKERLPTGGVADEALLAGGLPMDLLSSVAPAETLPTPPIPPEGGASAAPVVTDGAAAATSPTTPQAQADSLARLRDLIGGGDRPTLEDRGRENLMNFFFSMAASRNPSFFGQLGEAGQQLARADAAARAEALQERRLDIEAGYRASQEERQLRELLRDEDPNSPRARLIEAQIANLRASAARAGREGTSSRLTGQYTGDDGIVRGMNRQGRLEPYRTETNEPFRRRETDPATSANWMQAYNESMRNSAPLRGIPETAQEREARQQQAIADANAAVAALRGTLRPNLPGSQQQQQQQAPTRPSGVTRYDEFGRPITQ